MSTIHGGRPSAVWSHHTHANSNKYVIISADQVYGDEKARPFNSESEAERYALAHFSVEGFSIQPIRGKEW